MVNRKPGRLVFRRRHDFFRVGTLIVASWTMLWTSAVAEPPALVQKSVKAEALPAPGTYKIDPAHSFAYFQCVAPSGRACAWPVR
ncbi:hypothetical protein HDF11_001157 [Tunturiibacter psychrotolerans]